VKICCIILYGSRAAWTLSKKVKC